MRQKLNKKGCANLCSQNEVSHEPPQLFLLEKKVGTHFGSSQRNLDPLWFRQTQELRINRKRTLPRQTHFGAWRHSGGYWSTPSFRALHTAWIFGKWGHHIYEHHHLVWAWKQIRKWLVYGISWRICRLFNYATKHTTTGARHAPVGCAEGAFCVCVLRHISAVCIYTRKLYTPIIFFFCLGPNPVVVVHIYIYIYIRLVHQISNTMVRLLFWVRFSKMCSPRRAGKRTPQNCKIRNMFEFD